MGQLRRARLEQLLALLEAARAELDTGWVQGGWWSGRVGDGRVVPVSGLAAAALEPDSVDGVCLVGALVRAGSRQEFRAGSESGSEVGTAVDAAYDALWASRGQAGAADGSSLGRVSAPQVRLARVHTLTRWNDASGRTREDVLAVVDRAIARTILALCDGPEAGTGARKIVDGMGGSSRSVTATGSPQ